MDTTNLVNCEVTTILNDASQISSSSSSVADADEDLISKLTQFESNLIGSNVIYYMIKRRVELDKINDFLENNWSKFVNLKIFSNSSFNDRDGDRKRKYCEKVFSEYFMLITELAVFLKSVHDSADKKGKLEYFYATGNYLLYMFAKILRRLNNNSYDDKLKGIFLSKFNLRFEKRLENTLNASVDKQCVAIINDDEFTLNNFIEYLNLLSTNSSPSSSNNQKQQDFFNKFHRIIDNDFSQTLINDKLPIYINDEFMELRIILSVYDYKGYKNKPLDDECFTKCLERQIILIGDSICICLENIYIYYNEKIENVYNDKSKMKGIYKKSKEEYKKLLSEETN
ncbi:19256_t:CDS:2 [Entrophospora sp. SA101]|nr:19256_t:CDS:2 [Entrophospora sp. SA101]CAJ0912776.1 20626_t:CDS:2 [Entrophospora sp. SA101]